MHEARLLTPSSLTGTPPPLFDFVAFNFDLFTLSSPLPHHSINCCDPGLSSRGIDLSSSYWPAVSHNLWPLRVKPAAVWTSSSSTWPLSPPLRWSRWISLCSGRLWDYVVVSTEGLLEALGLSSNQLICSMFSILPSSLESVGFILFHFLMNHYLSLLMAFRIYFFPD